MLSHNSRILTNLCYVKGGDDHDHCARAVFVMLPELRTTTESQGANHLTRRKKREVGRMDDSHDNNLLYRWDIFFEI